MTVLHSVIVGYGHCGKNLHLVCLRKLQALAEMDALAHKVHVVDPWVAPMDSPGLIGHSRLPPSTSFADGIGVVHICTPPELHLQHVKEALSAGYRNIILEKPMVVSQDQTLDLLALQQAYNARILVVAVWAQSALITLLDERIKAANSAVVSVRILHNKSRFSRTLQRQGEHIFDIEMPHQVSLALLLVGEMSRLVDAHSESLHVGDVARPSMKSGYLRLVGQRGERVELSSDLCSPTRERRLRVEFEDGSACQGHFPVSADDGYSQFEVYDRSGARIVEQVLADEPLTACLMQYYRYFLAHSQGESLPSPHGSSIAFNRRIVEVLEQAKHLAVRIILLARQCKLTQWSAFNWIKT